MRDLASVPGLERSPGEGKGYPLQYSGLENSIDCLVHGVTKSRTRLSDLKCLKKIFFLSLIMFDLGVMLQDSFAAGHGMSGMTTRILCLEFW